MSNVVKIDQLLIFSEEKNKYFHTEFENINIVHGRNTSGKSTLFLSILYTFGINDSNQYLKEILEENVIFRIDLSLNKDGESSNIIIIREDDILYIQQDNVPLKRFNGISANNSAEHKKLKEYLNDIFDFSLQLESKNEIKLAPIETMFLPFYISQSVGWVYLRKSFSSLDYYKNFKEDYLDYYLGLGSSHDRLKKHELQKQLKDKESEIAIISSFEKKDEEIVISKLVDEQFITKSNEYIEDFSERHSKLTERESDYVVKCNELAFLQERKSVLQKVSSNHKRQQPEHDSCPTCSQLLPFGISETYRFLQEENDTKTELATIKARIKKVQSDINSLQNAIVTEREDISKEFSTLNKYFNSHISYDTWLKNKTNIQLVENLNKKIGELTVQKNKIEEDLEKYSVDDDIDTLRATRGSEFKTLFASYLKELDVKIPVEDRYLLLYSISAFPSQGVELHKTVMAYHFAFNKLIKDTPGIHRLPFMLDAIFKEDLDDESKKKILTFIAKNRPRDTQTIFSIAQAKDQPSNAVFYNQTYFRGGAKLIQIGDGLRERSLLNDYHGELPELINQTFEIVNGGHNSKPQ